MFIFFVDIFKLWSFIVTKFQPSWKLTLNNCPSQKEAKDTVQPDDFWILQLVLPFFCYFIYIFLEVLILLVSNTEQKDISEVFAMKEFWN